MKTLEEVYEMSDRLWEETKILGLKCLDNYFEENNEDKFLFDIKSYDFQFTKDKQSLIISDEIGKTFKIRTTYFIKVKIRDAVMNGHYSLDYNGEDEIIDDWLVFNY